MIVRGPEEGLWRKDVERKGERLMEADSDREIGAEEPREATDGPGGEPGAEPSGGDFPRHDLLELFVELTLWQKVRKVAYGLRQPRDTGDFKYARLQVLRLLAPFSAVAVPVLVMLGLMLIASVQEPPRPGIEVVILTPEPVDDLEDIRDLDEEPLEPPEPIDLDFMPQVSIAESTPTPAPPTDMVQATVEFDAVAQIRSPVIMRGMFGTRSPGARSASLSEYGGSGVTEGAVLRALRWLQKMQDEDGSWSGVRPAMTGLALLAFLAHGETPTSEEFGPVVEKALRWFVENQQEDGRFKGRDGHDYSHPIAAYALAEAYGLTRVPQVREAAEKAMQRIILGQHEAGGWDYNCRQSLRNDISYGGWCAQAVKAGLMAGLSNPGLAETGRRAVNAFVINAHPDGGFGYTSPGTGGLTGVGVLCMQLLGAGNAREVRQGLAWLDRVTFDWENPWSAWPIYHWYYITQAKFHAGPRLWREWNDKFAMELVRSQTVLPGEGIDGKDIGYWLGPTQHEERHGPVYGTTLCALMLQVYYRYLPTFKQRATEVDESIVTDEADDDIGVEIEFGALDGGRRPGLETIRLSA